MLAKAFGRGLWCRWRDGLSSGIVVACATRMLPRTARAGLRMTSVGLASVHVGGLVEVVRLHLLMLLGGGHRADGVPRIWAEAGAATAPS